jgi:hypothetical protein
MQLNLRNFERGRGTKIKYCVGFQIRRPWSSREAAFRRSLRKLLRSSKFTTNSSTAASNERGAGFEIREVTPERRSLPEKMQVRISKLRLAP